MVSWADRVAYVCHDWEDAVLTGIVAPRQLPGCGARRCAGNAAARSSAPSSPAWCRPRCAPARSAWRKRTAEALAAFRACNYERIYLRDASVRQGEAVVGVLRALVEHFADRPHLIADDGAAAATAGLWPASEDAVRAAVTYVAGMTDRFAFRQAVALLGWDPAKLPAGVDG